MGTSGGAVRQVVDWTARSARMVPLYRNWPVALADRVLLKGQERTYQLRDRHGGATLAARTWADTRIINELWLDDPYLADLECDDEAPLIVDVGSNRGYFCVQAAQRFPEANVVAYEPEPSNLELLATNIELNGLDRVDVRPIALVPDDRREVVLFEAVHPGYHSTLSPEEYDERGYDSSRFTGQAQTLACRNIGEELDGVMAEHGPISVLKIDTEGTELDLIAALPDQVLAETASIVAEIEEDPSTELLDHLGGAGFAIDISRYYLKLTRT